MKSWKIQKLLDPKCPDCSSVEICQKILGRNLECGVWKTIDFADSLEDALTMTSSLVNYGDTEWNAVEDELRILTPEGKII